ncbi:MAG TPA: hypothetical protein VGC04_00325 [Cellulomonas sp.]
MTAGDSIKHAAEGAKNVTDRVVEAVQDKINDATDAVEDAVRDATNKIHLAAGGDAKK